MSRQRIVLVSFLVSAAAVLLAADAGSQFRFFIPSDVEIREEQPSSEVAFTQASQQQDGDFGVRIELELSREGAAFRAVPLATPICNGDSVAFRFTPSAGGFAPVVNHGPSGAWTRLWPARPGEDASFGPNKPVRLPDQPGAGFPVSGPPGGEHVMVFFSPGPFSSEMRKLQDRLMSSEEAGAGGVAQSVTGGGTRAIPVTYLRDLGSA